MSWEKIDEKTLSKVKKQKEFEEQTAKKLSSFSESVQNPLIKALIRSIILDTTKHAETYQMLLDLNSSAIMGNESKELGRKEVTVHLKEEAAMLKQAKEISESIEDKNIKKVVENIIKDEQRHHRILTEILDMFERESKEWDAYLYDLITGFP